MTYFLIIIYTHTYFTQRTHTTETQEREDKERTRKRGLMKLYIPIHDDLFSNITNIN